MSLYNGHVQSVLGSFIKAVTFFIPILTALQRTVGTYTVNYKLSLLNPNVHCEKFKGKPNEKKDFYQ